MKTFSLQKQAEQELVQLTNEKGDFDMSLELERGKHKRRIEELTAQLEEAYRENSELRATGGPVAEGHSLDMSLQAALAACGGPMTGGGNLEASMQAANNLQVEQLNAQITELQEQLDRWVLSLIILIFYRPVWRHFRLNS